MTATQRRLDDRRWSARLAVDLDGTFAELVLAATDGLFSGLLRLTGSAPDAEDLVQETWVRAHRALHGMTVDQRAELRVSGWLWTIAVNRWRTWCGRRGGADVALGDHDVVSRHADAASTTTLERIVLVDALATLPPNLREAVVLHHVVGLRYREVAEVVERPEGTVKADVHRGLAALRSILTPIEPAREQP